MIDIKQAVSIAIDFVQKLYGSEKIFDILLEEVELAEDEQYWFVTIGFSRQPQVPAAHPLDALRPAEFVRMYKRVRIDAESGKVTFMKNGTL